MDEDATTWTWMSDDPLDSPGDDPRSRYFDRTAFISTTAAAIQAASLQSRSSVFGLIGAWGSGKTTIISSLAAQLESSQWRVHHFNPWMYSDAESLKWGFFSELREAVPPGDKWNDTRNNMVGFRDSIVPLAKLASAFGLNLGGAAEHLFDPDRLSATKMRERVSTQLEELVEPVLVVLDDLDRLTSTELLEVFKLVRFIGRLPNVFYLLCYDEETLVDLLESTDLVGQHNDRRALDYLEKIVQLRFDIPPLRPDLVETLFERALRGVVAKSGASLSADDEIRLRELLRSGLIERLTTPRSIRHLFAQIEAFLPSVANEVNTVDFVLLSWIRTFEPGLYGQLQGHRHFLIHGNGGKFDFEFDKAKAVLKRSDQLELLLGQGGVAPSRRETVVNALQGLFPAVGRIANGQEVSSLPRVEARRIADEFYFDRYFNFGVPVDDLSDATVRLSLAGLEHLTSPSSALVELQTHLISDTRRTIQKIAQERGHTSKESEAIGLWAIGRYTSLPEQHGWGTPRDLLSGFLAELIVDTEAAKFPELVREGLESGPETAYMLLDAMRLLVGRHLGSGDEIQAWNEQGKKFQTELFLKLPSYVAEITTKPVFELDPHVWLVIVIWGEFDNESVSELVRRRLNDGTWSILDVVARFVGSTVPSGSGPDAIATISGFDPKWAGNYISLSAVRHELAPLIESAGDTEPLQRAEASPENRRAYVLAWLNAHPDVAADATTE
ncbi:KAP family P-loop NTPase fold protein [Cryobacterium lyxosi]|nr:P-loop NTPase fold protein [Cryobacterium lyxosi]